MDIKDVMAIKVEDMAKMSAGELAQFQTALQALASSAKAQSDERRKVAEVSVFAKIGVDVAKAMTDELAWTALPPLILKANTGEDKATKPYIVAYYVEEPKKTRAASTATAGDKTSTGRTKSTVDSGDITLTKIVTAKGMGVDAYRVDGSKDPATGKPFATPYPKELVKYLKQADGKSEAERCWDIPQTVDGKVVKKGISSSDIITHYHSKEVTIVWEDGSEQTVEAAVAELKAARDAKAAADAAAPAAPAAGTTPAAPPVEPAK
jgi:hypothetical protein